jgi:hypothetical protein
LILEIPLEQADAALKLLGGTPVTGQERWVGIAPLASDGDRSGRSEKPESASRPAPSEGERLRTQAVMLCKDRHFQVWAAGGSHWLWEDESRNEEQTIKFLRGVCGVQSRAELATDKTAQEKFLAMVTRYRAETGQMAEKRGG